MTTPTVSIILPAFNRLHFLRAAVDSVFAQSEVDWELIVADDGSDKDTADYIGSLADSRRVRTLRLSHCGNPGAVRNAALHVARGRYVALLDSDDVWLPAKLAVQLAAHAACPARGWSYTGLQRIGADGTPLRDALGRRWVPYEGAIFEPLLTLAATVATPTVLADRRLIEQAGGFDERLPFFEDYDLWLRLSLLSDVIAIDRPLALVRNHTEHYSADRIRVYEARFRLLNKMSAHADTAHLRAVVRRERAKNAASLAFVTALAGHRFAALRMLWRSRECAWQQHEWWAKARATVAYALTPSWLQTLVRRHRRRRREHRRNQAA